MSFTVEVPDNYQFATFRSCFVKEGTDVVEEGRVRSGETVLGEDYPALLVE